VRTQSMLVAFFLLLGGCRQMEGTLCPELLKRTSESEAKAREAVSRQEEIRKIALDTAGECDERLRGMFEPSTGAWAMYNNLSPKVPTIVINAGSASAPTCNALLTYHPRTDRGFFYCGPLKE
jgi:hypothetical protein